MKNIFFASLMISISCFTPSCNKCKDVGGYYPDASQLKKYSFKSGSYWVYQDSITGIIDSQSVYYYTVQNNVVLGYTTGANGDIYCPVSTDAFNMSIASFWNGVLHDSVFIGNQNGVSATEVLVNYYGTQPVYGFWIDGNGSQTAMLTSLTVSGTTYPTVYRDFSSYNSVIYHVDNIGVVKWVFNDSISGQHTWNLLRYHVINL